jgi:hypothetical protein
MTAEIWNTYDLAVASGIGVFVGAVPVAALLILKRLDGSRELATARGWWEKAIRVQEANDKARWAPAYSENLFAIEAEKPHDAEVLHVEYPTGEIRALSADDPQVAAGLSALADEVGLVQALSDRPAEDEDEVGDEQPGEASTSWLVTQLKRVGDALDHAARVIWYFPTALGNGFARWVDETVDDLRDRFKSNDTLAKEFIAEADKTPWVLYDEDELRANGASEQELSMLRRGFVPIFEREELNDRFPENLPEPELPPLVMSPADEEELRVELSAWVDANPPTNPTYKPWHLNDLTAQYDVVKPGRHRAEGYTINVPLQRDGGDDL